VGLTILIGAGCSTHRDPPIRVTHETVCSATLDPIRHGDRDELESITIEGFLWPSPMVTVCGSDICTIELWSDASGTRKLKVDVRIGSGPNRMQALSPRFTNADFVAEDARGDIIRAGAKVRLRGERTGQGNFCALAVNAIELVAE
jgi:hypothetical protein